MLKAVVATGLALACWTLSGFAGEPATSSRNISYHASDVPPILTEKGYSTIVLLTAGEEVLQVTCGDCDPNDDHWRVEGLESVVLIKCRKPGAKTNVNIVTNLRVMSFLVREVSQERDAHADLRVAISADETMTRDTKPLFVSARESEELKKKLEVAKKELQELDAKHQADLKRDKEQAQRDVASSIRHDYTWKQNKQAKDFGLKSIYSLNGFTYFEAHPQEAPAIYELRDGKDSLVEFSLDPDGKYVVPKIIKHGYMRVGKAELKFQEHPGA